MNWKKVFIAVLMLLLCAASEAMKLDPNSIDEITTDPNQQVQGWPGAFAVFYPNPMVAWIDNRNPEVTSVYGVRTDDPNYTEFLIDPQASGCSRITASGTCCAYNIVTLNAESYLRVADVSNPEHPRRWDYATNWVNLLDMSGSVVVYTDSAPDTYVETVYAVDISDPNNMIEYPIRTLPSGEGFSGLAVDARTVVWSVVYSGSGPYVQIADITDLDNPVITTKILPVPIQFWSLDVSGQWLTAYGSSSRNARIFGVHQYTDIDHWNILTLWEEGLSGEYYVSGPRINGPVTAWVSTTRVPSLRDQLASEKPEYLLHSSYLMSNGAFASSVLRYVESYISAAEVLDGRVVWSENSTEMNLLKGDLQFRCGDWGYLYGDLNRDCSVDLSDFAIFARNWLGCTMPNGPGCEYGF